MPLLLSYLLPGVMLLNRRSLRSEAVNMLNSLDFSWQHVTYKTLASVWVLFVFYLSWLLLPEVSAIVHGLNNGSGTAGGATINPHPSPGPSSVRATQVTVVAPGATAGGDDLGFSVIGCVFRIELLIISLVVSISVAYRLMQDTLYAHARNLPRF